MTRLEDVARKLFHSLAHGAHAPFVFALGRTGDVWELRCDEYTPSAIRGAAGEIGARAVVCAAPTSYCEMTLIVIAERGQAVEAWVGPFPDPPAFRAVSGVSLNGFEKVLPEVAQA